MAGFSAPFDLPFCVASFIPPDSDYPLPVTKAELFRLFYRAKVFTIVNDITGTFDNGIDPPTDFDFSGSQEIAQSQLIGNSIWGDLPAYLTNEADYACPWRDLDDLDAFPTEYFGAFGGQGVEFHLYFGITQINGTDYYPQFTFRLSSSRYTLSASPGTSTGLTASIDGQSFDLFGTVDPNVTFTTFSSQVNITEYWPYDPAPGDLGGPIYDSATGATLRDPFSVQTWL